jgi:hypothetical protein
MIPLLQKTAMAVVSVIFVSFILIAVSVPSKAAEPETLIVKSSESPLIPAETLDAEAKIFEENPQSDWAEQARQKRCYADVVDAKKLHNGPPGCSSQDCKTEWVTDPPKRYGDWCEGNTCPLQTGTWYPAGCSNLLFNRCEVMVDNIGPCK